MSEIDEELENTVPEDIIDNDNIIEPATDEEYYVEEPKKPTRESKAKLDHSRNTVIPKDKLAMGKIDGKIPVRIDERTIVLIAPEKLESFSVEEYKAKYINKRDYIQNGRVITTPDGDRREFKIED